MSLATLVPFILFYAFGEGEGMLLGGMPPSVNIPGNFYKLPKEQQMAMWLNQTYTINAAYKCIKPMKNTFPEEKEDGFEHSCDPLLETDVKTVDTAAVPLPLKCCHHTRGDKQVESGECILSNKVKKAEYLCKCVPEGENCDGLVKQCCDDWLFCRKKTKTCINKKRGECDKKLARCFPERPKECCSGKCKNTAADVWTCA